MEIYINGRLIRFTIVVIVLYVNSLWQQLAKLQSLIVEGQYVDPLQSACNLKVTLLDQLTMNAHDRNIVRDCFYQPRQLRSVQ
jgi:hypothetical protein